MINSEDSREKLTPKDIARLLLIGFKVAIVIFAIFHASNLTILYQGF